MKMPSKRYKKAREMVDAKKLYPLKSAIEVLTKFPKAKFILITGEMSLDMVEKTRELGVDALMLKPFDARILEDNISNLLSSPG